MGFGVSLQFGGSSCGGLGLCLRAFGSGEDSGCRGFVAEFRLI